MFSASAFSRLSELPVLFLPLLGTFIREGTITIGPGKLVLFVWDIDLSLSIQPLALYLLSSIESLTLI